MSSKSKYRGQSASKFKITDKVPSEPRELTVIQEEYGRMLAEAGQTQYQLFVLDQQLQNVNERIVGLNQEAAARNKLDTEAKAAEVKKEEA